MLIFSVLKFVSKKSQKLESRGEAGGRYSKFKSRHYVNDLFKPNNLET